MTIFVPQIGNFDFPMKTHFAVVGDVLLKTSLASPEC